MLERILALGLALSLGIIGGATWVLVTLGPMVDSLIGETKAQHEEIVSYKWDNATLKHKIKQLERKR